MSVADGFIKICGRWGLDAKQAARIMNDGDEAACLAIGISVGLGDLFNDDAKAELAWLEKGRVELDGWTPIGRILTDGIFGLREVTQLLDEARGLT